MKHTEIEIDRQLETLVPVENETQRVLRAALALLGPNGENWKRVGVGDYKEGYCTMLVVWQNFSRSHAGSAQQRLMQAHGPESQYHDVTRWNDSRERTFSDIRNLYHRAIELAATPLPQNAAGDLFAYAINWCHRLCFIYSEFMNDRP